MGAPGLYGGVGTSRFDPDELYTGSGVACIISMDQGHGVDRGGKSVGSLRVERFQDGNYLRGFRRDFRGWIALHVSSRT